MGNLIGSLMIKETVFVVITLRCDCPLLILGKLGETTKISIHSDDQTCHLCNLGSIFNSTSFAPETTDLNQGCAVMRSNSVKICSQKTFETLKISLS